MGRVGAECKRMGLSDSHPHPCKREEEGADESNSHEDGPWPQRHDIDTDERKEPLNHKSGIVASGNLGRQQMCCECPGVSLIVPITCPMECRREVEGAGTDYGQGGREGLMLESILGDIRRHASTRKLLLGCVQLMRCRFQRDWYSWMTWHGPTRRRGGYASAGLEPGCLLREGASGFACLE